MPLNPLDLAVIIIYITVILAVGFFVGRRESLEDFLVNRRKTKLVLLVTSLVSSTVGAGFVFGTAAAAYQTGISFGLTMFFANVFGLLIISYFAPKINKFGRENNAHTIGDFFAEKYSEKVRLLVALLTLVAFFTYLGAQFVAIASLIKIITGIDFTVALVASALATIVYVTASGIKSDFYTDFIQFWLMVIFLFMLLLPLGLINLGGFGALKSLPSSYFDPFAFAGVEFFIGGLILGIPLYLVSMDMWQRIYAAENEKTAKRVFQLGAVVIIPFALLATLLGMMSAASQPNADPNAIIFNLMIQHLPAGLLGIGLAGVLAVVMSTIDSMLMAGTATLAKDFYKSFRKNASEQSLLKYARIFTVIFGLAGLATAFVFPAILDLVLVSAFILVLFVPATLAAFFWKRANSSAAFWSILLGFIVLLVALVFEPRKAFIPGTSVAIVLFVVLCYKTKKSPEEK